jgi:hypothetical protein
VTIKGQIESSNVDPLMRDLLRRWLVTVRVLEVREGELPRERDSISLLVHSPARTFRDPEIVGRNYLIKLVNDFADPYAGEVEISPG